MKHTNRHERVFFVIHHIEIPVHGSHSTVVGVSKVLRPHLRWILVLDLYIFSTRKKPILFNAEGSLERIALFFNREHKGQFVAIESREDLTYTQKTFYRCTHHQRRGPVKGCGHTPDHQ
jgi:hypothetical protein